MEPQATPPEPTQPGPQPKIDRETLKVILDADLANVVKKCKAGKPLSKEDKKVLLQAAGIDVNPPRRPDGTLLPGARIAAGHPHGGHNGKIRWHPRFITVAKEIAKHGLTDVEIAASFGVSVSTLNHWKLKNKLFARALKLGKETPNKKVERALFHRAIGYEHPDVDIRVVNGQIVQTPIIKHYPPDTTAGIYWSKNRDPERWRDKTEVVPQNPDGTALKGPIVHLILPAGRAAGLMPTEPDQEPPSTPEKA